PAEKGVGGAFAHVVPFANDPRVLHADISPRTPLIVAIARMEAADPINALMGKGPYAVNAPVQRRHFRRRTIQPDGVRRFGRVGKGFVKTAADGREGADQRPA